MWEVYKDDFIIIGIVGIYEGVGWLDILKFCKYVWIVLVFWLRYILKMFKLKVLLDKIFVKLLFKLILEW